MEWVGDTISNAVAAAFFSVYFTEGWSNMSQNLWLSIHIWIIILKAICFVTHVDAFCFTIHDSKQSRLSQWNTQNRRLQQHESMQWGDVSPFRDVGNSMNDLYWLYAKYSRANTCSKSLASSDFEKLLRISPEHAVRHSLLFIIMLLAQPNWLDWQIGSYKTLQLNIWYFHK